MADPTTIDSQGSVSNGNAKSTVSAEPKYLSLPFQSTSIRRAIIFSFWAVILIGTPLWYQTTKIYRAALPLQQMSNWGPRVKEFKLPLNFELISTSVNVKPYAEKLNEGFKMLKNGPLKMYNMHAEPKTTNKASEVGQYTLDIQVTNIKKSELHFSDNRHLTFKVPYEFEHVAADALMMQLPFLFYNEATRLHLDESADRKDLKVVKYSPTYQLTFSMLNGDPEGGVVDWDIRDAIDGYLHPLLEQLSPISNFTITSQVQHYAGLTFEPKKDTDETTNATAFILSPNDLPHFINSAEWSLASAVSTNPTIHLILYVPPESQRPMIIHDSQGKPTRSNAFLIPGWGGIVISNPTDKHRYTVQDLQPVMSTFTSHLRSLIGVLSPTSPPVLTGGDPNPGKIFYQRRSQSAALPLLEFDSLVRIRTIQNCADAASTLSSLSKLVQEIQNMVIGEEIREGVERAIDSLEHANESLVAGQYLSALAYSQDALREAEQAFFSPNMVSMLYFPDEHNYAIYTPLFAPISFPLIMALVKELRAMLKERKEARTKKKSKTE